MAALAIGDCDKSIGAGECMAPLAVAECTETIRNRPTGLSMDSFPETLDNSLLVCMHMRAWFQRDSGLWECVCIGACFHRRPGVVRFCVMLAVCAWLQFHFCLFPKYGLCVTAFVDLGLARTLMLLAHTNKWLGQHLS